MTLGGPQGYNLANTNGTIESSGLSVKNADFLKGLSRFHVGDGISSQLYKEQI